MIDFEALNKKALESAAKALNDLWCPTCQPYSATGDAHIQYCEKSARAAITAYLAAMDDGWQPIETAPRDGKTHILAYPVLLDRAAVVIWEPASRTPPMMRVVSGENLHHDGYWRLPMSNASTPYEPTHWCPLPQPPARAALKETAT